MIKILAYQEQDLEAITETINTFKEENQKRKLEFPAAYVDIQYYKEKILGITGKDTYIAKEEEKIVGFAVAHPKDNESNTYFLRILYVTPDSRGQDIATKIMKELINVAREKGYDKVQGKVEKINQKTVKLNRKMGFYNDHSLNDTKYYLMTKRIRENK